MHRRTQTKTVIDRSISQLLEVDISPVVVVVVVVECNHGRQLCWQQKKEIGPKSYKCMYVGGRRRERGNKRQRNTSWEKQKKLKYYNNNNKAP
jgi:hypothetical protein